MEIGYKWVKPMWWICGGCLCNASCGNPVFSLEEGKQPTAHKSREMSRLSAELL